MNNQNTNNSCLIRIIPLAIWGYKLPKEELYAAVHAYTMITHSAYAAIEATYLYCYAITLLIDGKSPVEVYNKTKEESTARAK